MKAIISLFLFVVAVWFFRDFGFANKDLFPVLDFYLIFFLFFSLFGYVVWFFEKKLFVSISLWVLSFVSYFLYLNKLISYSGQLNLFLSMLFIFSVAYSGLFFYSRGSVFYKIASIVFLMLLIYMTYIPFTLIA